MTSYFLTAKRMTVLKNKRNSLCIILLFLFLFGCNVRKEEEPLIIIGEDKLGITRLKKDFEDYKSVYNDKNNPNLLAAFISNLIEKEILKKEAKKLQIEIKKEELDRFVTSNNLSEKQAGIAELVILREKVASQISKDARIDEAVLTEKIKEIPTVEPEKIIFYQILVNREELAYNALKEIKQGAAFEEVAKKYSISPEGQRGGLIDYLNADELPDQLTKVLRGLKEGEISGVIKSPLGFHILKLKEIIKIKKLTDEERKLMAERELKKELAGSLYADWFAKKRKEYGVKVEWEKIKDLQ